MTLLFTTLLSLASDGDILMRYENRTIQMPRTVTTTICLEADLYRRALEVKKRRGGTFREIARRAIEEWVDREEATLEAERTGQRERKEAKAREPGGPGRFAVPTLGGPLASIVPEPEAAPVDVRKPSRIDLLYGQAAAAIVEGKADAKETERVIDHCFEETRRLAPLRHPSREEVAIGVRRAIVLEVRTRKREETNQELEHSPALGVADAAGAVVDVSKIRTVGDV